MYYVRSGKYWLDDDENNMVFKPLYCPDDFRAKDTEALTVSEITVSVINFNNNA
jgi:hypothetical protein